MVRLLASNTERVRLACAFTGKDVKYHKASNTKRMQTKILYRAPRQLILYLSVRATKTELPYIACLKWLNYS